MIAAGSFDDTNGTGNAGATPRTTGKRGRAKLKGMMPRLPREAVRGKVVQALKWKDTAWRALVPAPATQRVLTWTQAAPRHDAAAVAVRPFADRLVAGVEAADACRQKLAHFDPMTGLPNKSLFSDRMSRAISLAERTGRGVSLLALSLQGLTVVDDTYGAATGDRLLAEVANRLVVCVRDSDTVARLDRAEFVILQVLAGEVSVASALAQRVVDLLNEPYVIGEHRIFIRAKLGIALYPEDGRSGETLRQKANLALARVGAGSYSDFAFFAVDLEDRLRQREALEHDLRDAIRRGHLELNYQPIVDLSSSEIAGYEAFVRWRHPLRGDIAPEIFIPLADESGLMLQLGRWVMETACHEAAKWRQPHRVAVNLSPRQVRQPDLVTMILQTLKWSGLAADRLELEIAEASLLEDPEQAMRVLRDLKAHGVRIAVDGFGTGYSSLSYICRYPVDRIKIDHDFIQRVDSNTDAQAIVGAILALGSSLYIDVTAEGVESPAQLRWLRGQGCGHAQGFLLGSPVAASAIGATGSAAVRQEAA